MNENKINKINELIGEIIHIACQAELMDDEQIKRQALGDIADALASVVPVDYVRLARGASPTDGRACRPATADGRACRPATAADGKDVVYRTPQPIVDFFQSEMQRLEAWKARKIHWHAFSTKVDVTAMGRTNHNGKVYEIRILKRNDPKASTEFYCAVNGYTIMEGTCHCKSWMAKRMLESAMQAMVNYKARNRRMKRLADKRRAGILTPEEEVSATVARQMDDDDLAEQIENA